MQGYEVCMLPSYAAVIGGVNVSGRGGSGSFSTLNVLISALQNIIISAGTSSQAGNLQLFGAGFAFDGLPVPLIVVLVQNGGSNGGIANAGGVLPYGASYTYDVYDFNGHLLASKLGVVLPRRLGLVNAASLGLVSLGTLPPFYLEDSYGNPTYNPVNKLVLWYAMELPVVVVG